MTPAIRIKKKLLFTAMALGILVVVPITLLELILLASGWQPPGETKDPFLAFVGDQKLFHLSEDRQFFEIKESRMGYFRPARFLAKKRTGSLRIFVIGGSTVQGRPWETETAFPKWLELCLQAIDPGRPVEVINCGGVSYASYRLSLIVDEVIQYSPDMIILCTGHNEFLEERTYAQVSQLPAWIVHSHSILSRLKSYQWVRSLLLFDEPSNNFPTTTMGENLITKLDFENGLSLFDESKLQREQVAQHFRFNVARMIKAATNEEVPILILAPPSNQKDCFPFKADSQWSVDRQSPYSESSLDELQSIKEPARADYYYFRGVRSMESGHWEKAKHDFNQAIERDICPLRMPPALRRHLQDTVRLAQQTVGQNWVMFVDLQESFEQASPHRIVGDELLVDHVHPTISGHERIAKRIVSALQECDWLNPDSEWPARFDAFKTMHMATLDFGYFQRGKDRLESVRKWARGNANQPLKK